MATIGKIVCTLVLFLAQGALIVGGITAIRDGSNAGASLGCFAIVVSWWIFSAGWDRIWRAS